MTTQNMQVLLAQRPTGEPAASDFSIVTQPVPTPGPGQVLVRAHFLSLDPYMRGRMSAAKSYVRPVEIGEVMCGEIVGDVVATNNPKFAVGQFVHGALGWQQYALSDGSNLRRIDVSKAPASAWLGVLGMPAVTAHVGLLDIGEPKAGETVVVSAASGAVGSIVGQIARLKGARAIGIAGGANKCQYVTAELGFDACVDYKQANWREELKSAAPNGVDVYFDNVGGEILDAVLTRMNPFGRIPLCGLISQYNTLEPYGVKNFRSILVNRLRVQGFIVSDKPERWRSAFADLAEWYAAGKLRYRESIAEGLQTAPQALIGLLRGENFGKQLVRIL
jgi:NADPH-dependent curcumin reductase CurA